MRTRALAFSCLECGTSRGPNFGTSGVLARAGDHEQVRLAGVQHRGRSRSPVTIRGLFNPLRAFAVLLLTFNQVTAFNPSGSGMRVGIGVRRSGRIDQVLPTLDSLETLAGTPAILPELQARVAAGADISEILPRAFPFDLDGFQMDTLHALENQQSVIVSAPTGSGKTVCGELGIYLALSRGQRVIFTTPLKALSNQKFYDMKKMFGEERVGLLTGDICINREGQLLVMTTEVYRNMLLKDASDVYTEEERLKDLTTDYDPLVDVSMVILDEFHYMNDPYRGTIWEECCIFAPSTVQLIALSATLTNAGQITDWLNNIHGPTQLIATNFRPVPLQYYFCDNLDLLGLYTKKDAGPGGRKDEPTTVKKRRQAWKMNRKLTKEGRQERELLALDRKVAYEARQRQTSKDADKKNGKYNKFLSRLEEDPELTPSRPREQVPSIQNLVRSLIRKQMLPAIVFIFSRKGCDDSARRAASARGHLLSPQEERKVQQRVDAFRAANAELALDPDRLEWLLQGVAAHHAGLLPLEKSFIEQLFQDNLIKVVFATETLAAGINMPARCTVLTKLTKWSDDGPQLLTSSSTLQMAGRAGRRGKDDLGQVVFCRTPQEDAATAYKLLLKPPEPIESHFFVTYASTVKMLGVWTVEECQDLVERSFGTFLSEKSENKADKQLMQLEEQLCEYEAMFYDVSNSELEEYATVHDAFTRAERHKLVLQKAEMNLIAQTMEGILPFVPSGTSVRLTDGASGIVLDEASPDLIMKFRTGLHPASFRSMPFVLLVRTEEREASDHERTSEEATEIGSESTPAPALSLRIVEPRHVIAFDQKKGEAMSPSLLRRIIDDLPPAKEWVPRRDDSFALVLEHAEAADAEASQDVTREQAAASLSTHITSVPYPEPSGIVMKQEQRIERLRTKLEKMPLNTHPDREALVEAYGKHADLKATHAELREFLEKTQDDGESETWRQFKSICKVMQAYGALDEDWAPTEFGNLVGGLADQNELWLALVCVELSKKKDLTPPHLAGILAGVVSEGLRSDMEVNYDASEQVISTLYSLDEVAEKLHTAQMENEVEFPITMTEAACPLVEAWAGGDEWDNLVTQTSLDAGDIVRIFKKVIDALYRVSSVPYVSPRVKSLAREARATMNRYPVSDESAVVGLSNADEPIEAGEEEVDDIAKEGQELADALADAVGKIERAQDKLEEETGEAVEVLSNADETIEAGEEEVPDIAKEGQELADALADAVGKIEAEVDKPLEANEKDAD